jgi:hypothetical protein
MIHVLRISSSRNNMADDFVTPFLWVMLSGALGVEGVEAWPAPPSLWTSPTWKRMFWAGGASPGNGTGVSGCVHRDGRKSVIVSFVL